MSNHNIRKIALIGAGRLATNFAITLKERGYSILQVFSRNEKTGKKLAGKVASSFIGDLDDLTPKADLYALAVSDSAIQEVAGKIRLDRQLIIHFSGTVDLNVLEGASHNYGVLYPPQTFTKTGKPGFLSVPLCIEANNPESNRKLSLFAGTFSDKIFPVTSDQRKIIHLSAIFAGNFTNFMYAVAEDLLAKNDLPMDLVRPIIRKTASNARRRNIFRLQTGPAVREDRLTIMSHLDLLHDNPVYEEIYRIISENIIKYKHSDGKL